MKFFRSNHSIIVEFETAYTVHSNGMVVGVGYVLLDKHEEVGPYSAGELVPLAGSLLEVDITTFPCEERSKLLAMAKRMAKQVRDLPMGKSLGNAWKLHRQSEFVATIDRVPTSLFV